VEKGNFKEVDLVEVRDPGSDLQIDLGEKRRLQAFNVSGIWWKR
jgi:hypothetical protein